MAWDNKGMLMQQMGSRPGECAYCFGQALTLRPTDTLIKRHLRECEDKAKGGGKLLAATESSSSFSSAPDGGGGGGGGGGGKKSKGKKGSRKSKGTAGDSGGTHL
jgi:hypothetical protein